MIRKFLGILLLTLAALAQIKPDFSYTGNNDRFDISGMVSDKNKMSRDIPQLDDEEDDGLAFDADNRRYQGNEDTWKLKYLGNIPPPNAILNRRADGNETKLAVNDANLVVNDTKLAVNDAKLAVNDTKFADDTKLAVNDTTFADDNKFAEDDTNNSFEGGTVSDFEENLKKFQVN